MPNIDYEVFILKPEMVEIAATARIDKWVKIEGGLGVVIGEYVHIASFVHINGGGGRVEFGDHSGIASGARIIGGMPDISYLHVSAAEPPERCHVLRYTTRIGRYAVVFSNAVIYPGVTIGDGAIIAAGSVVSKDVPAYEVWGGCPAHKLRSRPMDELLDVDEYWALAQGVMAR